MKDRKRNSRLRTVVVFVAALLMASLIPAALAKKPDNSGGGGNSGGTDPVCVFADGDGIQSDDGSPYCNDKQGRVKAVITSGGYLELIANTISHRDPDAGRKLFVDLGHPLHLLGPETEINGPSIYFQSTASLPGEIESHNEKLLFRLLDGTDLRDMPVGEESTWHDLSMRIIINLTYSSGATGSVWINYDPDFKRSGCTGVDEVGTKASTLDVKRVDEATWIVEADGTDKAALRESYKSGGGPSDEVVFFCHTDPLSNPLGGGEALFALPAFTLTVTLQ